MSLAIYRLVLDQMTVLHSLAKLRLKISHHRDHVGGNGNRKKAVEFVIFWI